MRIVLFSFLLAFAAGALSAQVSFQKKLSVFLDSAMIRCTPDGQFVYVAASLVQNGQARLHLLKIDASGNLLWHLQHISTNTEMHLNDLLPMDDGVIVTVTTGQNAAASDGFLQKFDANGQPGWGKRVGLPGRTRLFELERGDQDNFFVTGLTLPLSPQVPDSAYYFLSYFQADGSFVKGTKSRHHYFPGSTDEIYQLTNISWNPVSASLSMIEDFRGPYTASYISSPNRETWSLGYTDQGFDHAELLWGIRFNALRSTYDHVIFSGRTVFTTDQLVIGVSNASGKNLEVLKVTPNSFQPVHSHSADIFFYDPQEKTLTQYDTTLTAIWSRKFDNCQQTKSFDADVASNGVIYTIRNVGSRTVVSKILPGGIVSDCPGYPATAASLPDLPDGGVGDVAAIGEIFIGLPTLDSTLVFAVQQTELNDFCVRLDAAFDIPDTICLGADILLSGVDTTAGLSHGWQFGGQSSNVANPDLSFSETGLYGVSHLVTNPLCSDTASHAIRVIAAPVLSLADTLVCGPASFSIDLTDPAATQYWLDGAPVDPQINISQSGVYDFKIANAQCGDERTIEVKIVEFPWPLAEPDTTLCSGVAYPLAFAPGFEAISWDGELNPDTFFILDGAAHTYMATYTADPDCVIRGTIHVPRTSCQADLLYVPNSFSPNGDGTNDFFAISPTVDAEVLHFSLYDRWGGFLFQSDTGQEQWDGKFKGVYLPPGVYIYRIEVRNKLTDEIQIKTGDLTLFR